MPVLFEIPTGIDDDAVYDGPKGVVFVRLVEDRQDNGSGSKGPVGTPYGFDDGRCEALGRVGGRPLPLCACMDGRYDGLGDGVGTLAGIEVESGDSISPGDGTHGAGGDEMGPWSRSGGNEVSNHILFEGSGYGDAFDGGRADVISDGFLC